MARVSLPRLPPHGRKYRQYLLSFLVTLGAGMSPLWGGKYVPGFRAILDVFPAELQDVIPWASLLLSVTAVGVQFFGGEAIEARRITRGFIATFGLLVVLIFALFVAYKATVIRVQVPGARANVAYLVGTKFLQTCPCEKLHLEIMDCIGKAITANPADVAACYPRQQLTARATLLSTLYMLLMLSLGILIGLLVLKEALPKQRRRAPAKEPRRRPRPATPPPPTALP